MVLYEHVVVLSLLCGLCIGEELDLYCEGLVVLDAPITFTGVLSNTDPEDTYRWSWQDDASPGNSFSSDHSGLETTLNYTVSYPSAEYDETRYIMKLSIYKLRLYFWENVAYRTMEFNVTRNLNGQLIVKQGGTQSETMLGHSIVNSVNKTEISVDFQDPCDFINTASKITFFWLIDTVFYGQTSEGVFSYTFSMPKDYQVETIVIADFNNTLSNHSLNTAKLSHLEQRKLGVKMGFFNKKVISKDPISNLTVSGHKTLKHGELVNLNIDCNGSGAWLFCWQIVEKGYNITGNEVCDDPKYRKDCSFSIMWYFKNCDTYNLLVIVSNDVSSHLEVVAVTIYEVASQLPLSIVIIPVIAAIAAIVLLISGIGLYANFKSHLAVEVADFDFNTAEEEELQYKTFWERLRESFGTAFTSGDDLDSEGSSMSGKRSVQMPGVAGISYGSIT